VFAFGSILFESLSGQRAFDAPNFNALIVTIATKQPKSLNDVAPNLPEGLRALVHECMVTEKDKRLASVDLLAERLTALIAELGDKSELHLPSQYGVERSSDPDATNALPVMRKSERPPQPAATLPAGHPSPLAMQITNPPMAKKPLDVAVAWLRHAEKVAHGLPPRQLAAAAGGAGAVVVLVIVGLAAAFSRSGGTPQPPALTTAAASGGTSLATAPTFQPPLPTALPDPKIAMSNVPSADESADVPTYSVDSLPVATRGAPGKGNGRLAIVATPGWCAIIVDGQRRGVTPLNAFELPAGSHKVECVPPNRPAKTATVNVAEGTAAHIKFALDE
jgi:hypothetical protein